MNWRDDEFKIGLNMAGAISAGAYTAGVIDFLMEALEEWEEKKTQFRTQQNAQAVPLHDVSIEVFSGASAGGMCAAIAATMVQHSFAHIKTGDEEGTDNTFYESWVNKIDIRELLGVTDIRADAPIKSLLDCRIIDDIAEEAIHRGNHFERPYVAKNLTLFLTLTNARGVPYKLYSDPLNVDEFIAYYGDRLQFEVVPASVAPTSPTVEPLPMDPSLAGSWDLLREAAKATGAFPIVLLPRVLSRKVADYDTPQWIRFCNDPTQIHVRPAEELSKSATWKTLNIDGGVTNNNPFQLAHDFLALRNKHAVRTDGGCNCRPCQNPREPEKANCAVITVAPFPAHEKLQPGYDTEASAGIWAMLPRLISILLSQSRFLGESLEILTAGSTFSRFVIAPSIHEKPDEAALQCQLLGAFGGFFERRFRKHDFLLGRRNCQKFLNSHFCLPFCNRVVAAGLDKAGDSASSVKKVWGVPPPDNPNGSRDWMPIIPLCGSAQNVVPLPDRGRISKQAIAEVTEMILSRTKAIASGLLAEAPEAWPVKLAINAGLSWPLRLWVRSRLFKALAQQFKPYTQEPI